nr:integrase, catalytic region, zinc finger, CCHC-type, peptidase aspartic, catalytic [Tanacetum cinerariifolium]
RLTEDTYDDIFDYQQQFEKLVNSSTAKKLEKSHDPLALVAHTSSFSRTTSRYYVTHPSLVVDYDDDYQEDAVARAITQRFSNPTNNRLRTSSNTRNQAIVQVDRVQIECRNSGNDGRNTRRSYVQEEVIKGPSYDFAFLSEVVQIVLWIFDSGCSKHMTGDRTLLKNFVEKLLGTVRFGNDHFAVITGYGDYVQGNIIVCHVYYVEGLGHNLFSVGKFCDSDLEVAFCFKTCYVRNLEGDDFLIGARESNLYTISISDMAASSPVCLMSKATSTKSWLWHRRLSHLNLGTINDLTKHDLFDGVSKFKYSKDHPCFTSESMNTPSKEDLYNLFRPMYEGYFKKRPFKVSINYTTQQVHNHKDSSLISSIIVEEHGIPPIVTVTPPNGPQRNMMFWGYYFIDQ